MNNLAEVPRFIEILALAKLAHELGQDEYLSRQTVREFPGALPKRKHGPRRVAKRVERKGLARQIIVGGSFSAAEQKLLAAAYDQGLFDRHNFQET